MLDVLTTGRAAWNARALDRLIAPVSAIALITNWLRF
jgi:hypothetical protein